MEALEGVQRGLVMIVFRGGWIDGILVKKGFVSAEELEKWIEDSVYFKELNGYAVGSHLAKALGRNGRDSLRSWAKGKGLVAIPPCARNLGQAAVIIDGLETAFEEKA